MNSKYNLRNARGNMAENADISITVEDEATVQINQQFTNIESVLRSLGNKMENSGSSMTFCPSFFSGLPTDDPISWLERFRAWVDFNNWKDPNKIFNAMKLRLAGSALEWIKNVSDICIENPETLFQAFKDHFQNIHPKWLLEQQLYDRRMREDENLEDYANDIEKRCILLQKTEKDKVMCFIRGITATLRMFVIQRNPQNWQEALHTARLANESVHILPQFNRTADDQMQISSVMQCIKSQNDTIAKLSESVQKLTVSKNEPAVCAVSGVTCQMCDKPGHIAKNCNQLPRFTGQKKEERRCYKCGTVGHIQRNCRKN